MKELKELAKLKLEVPKGIKKYIWEYTDFQTRNTILPRYVETIEIWHGKLLLRTFGFVSKTRNRLYKDIQIKEVHRELEGYKNCLLKDVYCDLSGHRVIFDRNWNEFHIHEGKKWRFYSYQMYDKEKIIRLLKIPYCQYLNPLNKSCLTFFDYICKYREEPKIELLVKADLSQFINGLRYLDLKEKSIDKIFKINKKWIPYLNQMDMNEVLIARRYDYITNLDLDTIRKIKKIKKYKFINKYLDKNVVNYLKNVDLHIYNDYLRFAEQIGMNMKSKKNLCPNDLLKAHDKCESKIQIIKDPMINEKIGSNANKYKSLIYEHGGFVIYPVNSVEELIKESRVLNHCVRTYATDIADGKSHILLVRDRNHKEVPLYTLELKKKKIIQFRGNHNKVPSSEAVQFIKKWSKLKRLELSLY